VPQDQLFELAVATSGAAGLASQSRYTLRRGPARRWRLRGRL